MWGKIIEQVKLLAENSIAVKLFLNVKRKGGNLIDTKPIKYTAWILVIAFFLVVLCMEFVKQLLPYWFDKTQWGALVSGSWAYIGTCFMGLLAIWQNQRFKKENDAAQARVQSINERLLNVEEAKFETAIGTGIEFEYENNSETVFSLSLRNDGPTTVKILYMRNIKAKIQDEIFESKSIGWPEIPAGTEVQYDAAFKGMKIGNGDTIYFSFEIGRINLINRIRSWRQCFEVKIENNLIRVIKATRSNLREKVLTQEDLTILNEHDMI